MLLAIGISLFILWLFGLIAFHITAGLIHLLLIVAAFCVIVYLVRLFRSRNL